MNKNQERNLEVLSRIDESIVEWSSKKRAVLKNSCKKKVPKKKWYIMGGSIAAALLLVLGTVLLLVNLLAKQVPIYTGMTVSNEAPVATAKTGSFTVLELNGEGNNGNHYGHYKGDCKGDQKIPDEPFPNKPLEDSLEVIGAAEERYYAKPGEDIYITVHIENPDAFEILSFTLNGEKYSSYMFEAGSDMENLVLKVNVGATEGVVEYTIDAIKYVDGTEIKDVRMEGDQTVEVGVSTDKQPSVSIGNMNVGFNSVGFTVSGTDEMGLIADSEGKVEAVLYNGDTIIAKKSVSLTEGTTVTFDGLDPNTLYQYAIVASYDALDGKGYSSYVLKKQAFYTEAPLLFDSVTLSTTGVSFDFLRHANASGATIESLVLSDGTSSQKLNATATSKDGLLPATSYTLTATYRNGDRTETITLEFTTAPLTYTVNHYLADLNGGYGDAVFTETKTVALNATYTAVPAQYTGFDTPEVQSGTATVSGDHIINYYYERTTYDISLVRNDGTSAIRSLKFGAALPEVSREGFEFGGWFTDEECTKAITTVPAEAISVYAQWVDETVVRALSYTTANNEIIITGLRVSLTELVIPAYIGGKPVTVIDDRAFAGLAQLTSVRLPGTLRELGQAAFQGCKGLTEMIVPDSVITVGDHLFSGCSALERLTIPFVGKMPTAATDTHQYPFGYIFGTTRYTGGIPTESYYHASSLTEVTQVINYIPLNLKSVTVTGGHILRGAFQNCNRLENIVLPESLSAVGENAFNGCHNLLRLTVPATVQTVGNTAFAGCYKLVHVTNLSGKTLAGLPEGDALEIHTSAGAAFEGVLATTADGFVTLTKGGVVYLMGYHGSATTLNLTGKGFDGLYQWALFGHDQLTELVIPSTVSYIGAQALNGCSGLVSLTVPFVGHEQRTENDPYQMPFGYIFGETEFAGSVATSQSYFGSNPDAMTSAVYRIPTSLRSVTVLGGHILLGSFQNCAGLTAVVLPGGITKIGEMAFRGCSALAQIALPDTVLEIGDYAFESCVALANVRLSQVLTAIGAQAFINCAQITSLTVPSTLTTCATNAFTGCTALSGYEYGNALYLGNASDKYIVLLRAKSLDITSCAIHATTRWIHYGAFENCEVLRSAELPASIKEIGNAAFSGCKLLSSVTFAQNSQITKLPTMMFAGCAALGSIEIPACVTSLGSNLFQNCTSLTTLVIPATVETVQGSALAGCTGLQSLTVPFVGKSKTTRHAEYIYPFGWIFGRAECQGATATSQTFAQKDMPRTISTTYYIPNSLRSVSVLGGTVPYGAFQNCANLTSVTLPANATEIGQCAFEHCTSLTSIDLPTDLTTVANNAFKGAGLTSLTIPAKVTTLGENAFANCAALARVNYMGTLAEWCGISFASATANPISTAKNLYINDVNVITATFAVPTEVTSIGAYAFYGCTTITDLTIPASVTSVGTDAFNGCALVSVAMPTNVIEAIPKTAIQKIVINGGTEIAKKAFWNCTELLEVVIADTVTTIGGSAFFGCTSLAKMTMPVVASFSTIFGEYSDSLKTVIITSGDKIEYAMFAGTGGLTSVILPESIISIESEAFSGCRNLKFVDFGENSQLKSIGDVAFTSCISLDSIVLPASVTSIGYGAFGRPGNYGPVTIYYRGTAEEWNSIDKNEDWGSGVCLYYYSETTPTTAGNYWYYDANGDVAVWPQVQA